MKSIPAYIGAGPTARHTGFNTFTANYGKWTQRLSLLFAFVLTLGGASAQAAAEATPKSDVAGIYKLVSVDAKKVPTKMSHEGADLDIRSGSFTIEADGKCSSKMIFVPPTGKEVTLVRPATYTRQGPKLTMQWQGAGRTTGSVKGNRFTMENEGMVFVYEK